MLSRFEFSPLWNALKFPTKPTSTLLTTPSPTPTPTIERNASTAFPSWPSAATRGTPSTPPTFRLAGEAWPPVAGSTPAARPKLRRRRRTSGSSRRPSCLPRTMLQFRNVGKEREDKKKGFEKGVAGKVAEMERYFFVIGIFLRIFFETTKLVKSGDIETLRLCPKNLSATNERVKIKFKKSNPKIV